jgi:hypothetical protein
MLPAPSSNPEGGITMTKIAAALACLVLLSGPALAGEPVENINPKHHPNLAKAQKLSRDAFDKISAAQRANEWDMEGHAAKAKELLQQVNEELKLAAMAANKNAK